MKIPRSITLGATLLSVLFSCKPQETQILPVASISVNPTSLTLEEGETSNISATVSPSNATDKTVTWSSSSNAVATIKEGVVTAVKEGSATITAKAGGKTAVCDKGYGWQDDPVGYYWSKSLYTSDRKQAYLLGFTEDSWFTDKMERCNGMLVRPVINK